MKSGAWRSERWAWKRGSGARTTTLASRSRCSSSLLTQPHIVVVWIDVVRVRQPAVDVRPRYPNAVANHKRDCRQLLRNHGLEFVPGCRQLLGVSCLLPCLESRIDVRKFGPAPVRRRDRPAANEQTYHVDRNRPQVIEQGAVCTLGDLAEIGPPIERLDRHFHAELGQ